MQKATDTTKATGTAYELPAISDLGTLVRATAGTGNVPTRDAAGTSV